MNKLTKIPELKLPLSFQAVITGEAVALKELMGPISDFEQEWRGKVLNCSLSIEHSMELLICEFFFPGKDEKKDDFKLLLGRPELTFHLKKNILRDFAQKKEGIEKKDLESFDKIMSDVVALRNIFAHGKLIVKKEKQGVKLTLEYFDNKAREKKFKEITEKYALEISSIFGKATMILNGWLKLLHDRNKK